MTKLPEISSQDWFVAFTKPAKENLARENLLKQNYFVELPMYKLIKLVRGKWSEVIEPMFPRYIFFKPATLSHSIRPARSTIGIQKLVTFGDNPASISDSILQNIINISHSQITTPTQELNPLHKGDKVSICNGALKGMVGMISNVRKDRIAVLIEILGREKEVIMSLQELRVV